VASQPQSLVTRATITPAIIPRVAPPQTAFGPFQCNNKSTAATIAIIVVASTVFLLFIHYITAMDIALAGASKRGESPSFFFFPLSFEGEGDTGGEVELDSHFRGNDIRQAGMKDRQWGDKGGSEQ